ncbi:MAG TPA: hypothetical protein PLW50_07550, partial [Smithellaceae bacterium]|nr:hypothetical protein [Smithellaceae bacterium]
LQDPTLLETGKKTGGSKIWHGSRHWKNKTYIEGMQTAPITVQSRVVVRIQDKAESKWLCLF